MSIGIGTVIITVLQQRIDNSRQHQERELDDRRYVLDQLLANLSRDKDLEIDEVRRKQDRELDDRRYELEQKQADDLHYQGIFKSYIDDISNVIFKMNQTFSDDSMKYGYIRSKTLTALRSLDSKRKTFLFLFLYETRLLMAQLPITQSVRLDVSTFDFNEINVIQTVSDYYVFKYIYLPFVMLVNARFIECVFDEPDFNHASMESVSFIQCEFHNEPNFFMSSMANANFTGSEFNCQQETDEPNTCDFNYTILTRADFSRTFLCEVTFNNADLSYANFSYATLFFVKIIETNMAYADFSHVQLVSRSDLMIKNVNMKGAIFSDDLVLDQARINVILPNGTWNILDENIIRNGDAETCSDPQNNGWGRCRLSRCSTVVKNENINLTDLGKCYFNFSSICDNCSTVLSQEISLNDYSVFIQTNEAAFQLSANINCIPIHELSITIRIISTSDLNKVFIPNRNESDSWWTWKSEYIRIPLETYKLSVYIKQNGGATFCYIDNIDIRIYHQKDL